MTKTRSRKIGRERGEKTFPDRFPLIRTGMHFDVSVIDAAAAVWRRYSSSRLRQFASGR
jgi:hypothetical protein